MRLINVDTFKLETFIGDNIPPFAILSHTWGPDEEEVSFQEIQSGDIDKPGSGTRKLKECCLQAKKDHLQYAWLDTCCINKESDKELAEAINSMFQWYQRAAICYAYLADVPSGDNCWDSESKFFSSRWFQRGWTLQELLAPAELQFYSQDWTVIGTKMELSQAIEKITGISRKFLLGWEDFRQASVAQRMSWAARRKTSRKEDSAYCLLGIFDVTMPMIYGEGDRALSRLQEEILRTTRDHSILAWGLGIKASAKHGEVMSAGIMATKLLDFANCGRIVQREQEQTSIGGAFNISGGHLRIRLPLYYTIDGGTYALLNCGPENDQNQAVGIPVQALPNAASDEYVRPQGRRTVLLPKTASAGSIRSIYIQTERQATACEVTGRRLWLHLEGYQKFNLSLEEGYPSVRWDKGRALILETKESENDIRGQYYTRFRTRDKVQQDLVVVLDFRVQGSQPRNRYHVMMLSRDISLAEFSESFCSLRKEVLEKHSAQIGPLGVQVSVDKEQVAQEPVFVVRLAQAFLSPKATVNANLELGRISPRLEIFGLLRKGVQASYDARELTEERDEMETRLHKTKDRLIVVEKQLKELVNEKRLLSNRLKKETQGINQLKRKLADTEHRREECLGSESEIKRHLSDLEIDQGPGNWLEAIIKRHLDTYGLTGRPKTMCDSELDDSAANPVSPDKKDYSPLLWAIMNEHEIISRLLIESGADLESKDCDGNSPLLLAAISGQETVVKMLLARGVNYRAENKNGKTAYAEAIAHGQRAIAELLKMLPPKTLPKSASVDGSKGLEVAVRKGQQLQARLLIDKGADLEARKNGNTPLLVAASLGDNSMVEMLLQKGANLEATNTQNNTPLIMAVLNGHEDTVRLLLDQGANLEAKGVNSGTALQVAVVHNQEAIVRLLLKRNADLESENNVNLTALHLAVSGGNIEIIRLLLGSGANLEAKTTSTFTPLFLAVSKRNTEAIKLLLEKGASLETKIYSNHTPLHLAVSKGYTDVIKLLFEEGADLETKKADGHTPLHTAVLNGNEEVIELLLAHGADLETKNSDGYTPLHTAVANGSRNTIELLIRKGASLEARENQKETPLKLAVLKSRHSTISLLLDRGADREAKGLNSDTALLAAVLKGDEPATRLLLEKGAVLETQNKDGNTPLLLAISRGDIGLVKLLLDKGANIEAPRQFGDTPLFLAIMKRDEAIIKLLLKKGVNLEARNQEKRTPLLSAVEMGSDVKVIKLLLDRGANIEATNGNGDTAIFIAVYKENEAITQLLLENGADTEVKNKIGYTPLRCARKRKSKVIVKLLSEKGATERLRDRIFS